jgi:hypothetical protein
MPEKPKMMWHADAEGKCHAGCEQSKPIGGPGSTCSCDLLDSFFGVMVRTAYHGRPCPFAILASVLCCGQKSDEEHRCGTCNEHEPDDRMIPGKCSRMGISMYDDSGKNCPNYTPKVTLDKPVAADPSDDLVERCCRVAFDFHKKTWGVEGWGGINTQARDGWRAMVRAVLKEAQKR